jgi:hypothetical protein
MIATHIPWYRLMSVIQQRKEKKAEQRASIFKEKSVRPHSLKRGTSKTPSMRESPDLANP